jgi:hypothetical protein
MPAPSRAAPIQAAGTKVDDFQLRVFFLIGLFGFATLRFKTHEALTGGVPTLELAPESAVKKMPAWDERNEWRTFQSVDAESCGR